MKEVRRRTWKSPPQRVTAPYYKNHFRFRWHLSSAEHEEFRVNLPGPPGKAKHNLSAIVHLVP